MHVCHVITGLGAGGTPVMLRNVLDALSGEEVRSSVIGLTGHDSLVPALEALGAEVHVLGMSTSRPDPRLLWRLASCLRRLQPHLIQTWLYHADLLGGLAARWCGRPPVVWNLRHATLRKGIDSRSTLLAAGLCARLSRRIPRLILANSHAAIAEHVRAGYDARKLRYIPNGFDTSRFRPCAEARAEIRRELGLAPGAPLVGLVARCSPLKGTRLFVEAMSDVSRTIPEAHFLMCGADVDRSNAELSGWIAAAADPSRFHLLGERRDTPALQASLDVAVSASFSEAFSNSIGEALACGVPVVTTDAGDSAGIVGSAGRVVPIGDQGALAAACAELLSLPEERRRLGEIGRAHVCSEFALDIVARRYFETWKQILGNPDSDGLAAERAA